MFVRSKIIRIVKRLLWVSAFVGFLVTMLLAYFEASERNRLDLYRTHMADEIKLWRGLYHINLPGCRLPYVDPYNPAILKDWFGGGQPPSSCYGPGIKRSIFSTKVYGKRTCPLLNETILRADYYARPEDIDCDYRPIRNDLSKKVFMNEVVRGPTRPLRLTDCPDEELILVSCSIKGVSGWYVQALYTTKAATIGGGKKSRRNTVFRRQFGRSANATAHNGSNVQQRSVTDSVESRPSLNVAVIGIDSVSRLSLYRTMPRTVQTLRALYGQSNAVELEAFNKVGINSAPNQIPFLTGQPFHHETDMNDGQFFDDFARFIWQDFADNGYATLFAEEQMQLGLFLYPSRRGFRRPFTDHWPRPLTIVETELRRRRGPLSALRPALSSCIGGKHFSASLLRYWLDTQQVNNAPSTTFPSGDLSALAGQGAATPATGGDQSNARLHHHKSDAAPLFAYVWLSEATHDNVGGAASLDGVMADFFHEVDRRGQRNNTIILFLSDHGYRMAPYRDTPLGRLEDMLPFGWVLLPPCFAARYPAYAKRLRVNARRLVTPYDIYATLKHLAQLERAEPSDMTGELSGSLAAVQPRPSWGRSLFSEEISDRRDCPMANIEARFCACYTERVLAADDPRARQLLAVADRLAARIATAVNQVLDDRNASRCARLSGPLVRRVIELVGRGEENESLPARFVKIVITLSHPPEMRLEQVFSRDNVETKRATTDLARSKSTSSNMKMDDKEAIFMGRNAGQNKSSLIFSELELAGQPVSWTMQGLPDRLDRYDRFSSCVRDTYYEKFCYCQ